jgi:hypothetical protein
VSPSSDRRKGTDGGDKAAARYEVRIRARAPSKRELQVRERAAELSRRDPDRFISVVRDAARRERAGADPTSALEQALKRAATKPPDSGSA